MYGDKLVDKFWDKRITPDRELWETAYRQSARLVRSNKSAYIGHIAISEQILGLTKVHENAVEEAIVKLAREIYLGLEKQYKAANEFVDRFLWAVSHASPNRRARMKSFAEHGHAITEVAAGVGAGWAVGDLLE